MRYALAAIAMFLCACGGGHHHADPHPVNADFDPVVGYWQGTCVDSSGAYATIAPSTTAVITIDDRGFLQATESNGQSFSLYLNDPGPGATTFQGARTLSNGDTEYDTIYLGAPTTAAMFSPSLTGAAHWRLAGPTG